MVLSIEEVKARACGYLAGKIQEREKELEQYDKLENDVVLLTANYTLGPLKDLKAEELDFLVSLYDDLCRGIRDDE